MNQQSNWRRPHAVLLAATLALGIGGVGVAVAERMGPHAALELKVASADEPAPDKIPFSPQAKKIMALAVREALRLGHNYVGTEHILIAVLEYSDGAGGGALTGLGLTRERAAQWLVAEVTRLLEEKQRAAG